MITSHLHSQDALLAVVASPVHQPFVVVGVDQDLDGWWTGWSQPVSFFGLVERKKYREPTYLESEHLLEPLIFDGSLGFRMLSDVLEPGAPVRLLLSAASASWEAVVGLVFMGGAEW